MANILVVDDSSTVRNEVGGFLGKNGFDIAYAVTRASSSWSAT
jgi:two-component system chemotaxis response regulator CheY